MTEEAVKVAVRVRPFNSREKERQSKLTIRMNNKTTTILNPKDDSEKNFAFDHSYWSHDGFVEQENGFLEPSSSTSPYCSQAKVFDDLGQGVLKNAFEGYNCSLFAYGQTGSGKSYSMVGTLTNRGIVPMTCDKLFKKIDENKDGDTRYCVSFSMMEIYMEKVRDLLASSASAANDLPVRQSDKQGFFVQDLTKVIVGSYDEIDMQIEQGTARRTIASTNMNATSSRAHTVVTISFDQIKGKTKRSSEINLVDLAGSERQESTGATGDRLKEGAKINQSLSTLGKVISVLAMKSRGKVIVPYRESVLTKLLMNALGGNSKTIMIAALSPADINYAETLSTLQYADRVKSVKTVAVVNENPMEKLIRDLRSEIEHLRDKLERQGVASNDFSISPEEREKLRKEMEKALHSEIMANMRNLEMLESGTAYQQKVEAQREAYIEEERRKTVEKNKLKKVAHLRNVNEDPALTGILLYYIEAEQTTVGTSQADPPPKIALKGLSIQKEHAIFTKRGKTVEIQPGSQKAKTLINGIPLNGSKVLKHRDRILFGSNHLYLFLNPLERAGSENLPKEIDWEFAQQEIAEAEGWKCKEDVGLTEEKMQLNRTILELVPLVNEVNAIAREMEKDLRFEVILPPVTAIEALFSQNAPSEVFVKIEHTKTGNEWLWDHHKFINRRFMIKEAYNQSLEQSGNSEKSDDPFWEKPVDIFAAASFVVMVSLVYCLEHSDQVTILDMDGRPVGRLEVVLSPTDDREQPMPESLTCIDDPSELVGAPFAFKISLKLADLDLQRLKNTWNLKVHYQVFQKPVTITNSVLCHNYRQFHHEKVFHYANFTQELLEMFTNQSVSFFLMRLPTVTAKDLMVDSPIHRCASDSRLDSEGQSPAKIKTPNKSRGSFDENSFELPIKTRDVSKGTSTQQAASVDGNLGMNSNGTNPKTQEKSSTCNLL